MVLENVLNAARFLKILVRMNADQENIEGVNELLDALEPVKDQIYVTFSPIQGSEQTADLDLKRLAGKDFADFHRLSYQVAHGHGFQLLRDYSPNSRLHCGAYQSPPRPPLSTLHQPKPKAITGPVELAGRNAKLLTMRGTQWIEKSTFPQGYRNQALYCYTLILKAGGLSKRKARKQVDGWCQTRTRPVYGRFPDRAQEPQDTFEKTWNTPYHLQCDRLRALRNAKGEGMPESWAIELTRAYPSLKARSERVHQPQFATVAKILDALVKARAFDGKALSHVELARIARVSPHQVAKVAGFLAEIGVRTTTRRGQSTISLYTLKHLNTPPPQLIKCFAKWRGYAVEWRVLAKRLWASVRAWMVKAFNAVNSVCNKITCVWQGEGTYTEAGEAERTQPRGPPSHTKATEAISSHQAKQRNGLSRSVLEGV